MSLRRFFSPWLFLLASVSTLSASPGPGIYSHWKGEIDSVVVHHSFRADDFQDIVVEPLDVSQVVIPERSGESPSAIAALLASLKPAFLEGMQKNLRHRTITPGHAPKSLVIRIHLLKADPGTRNPKFGDLKSNAAKLAVRGEVVDPATGVALLEFKQERWSGVVTIGKNSGELLQDAAKLIGHDIADLISAF